MHSEQTPTPTPTRSLFLLSCMGLIVVAQMVLWWRAVHWYPQLPARFPTHFNASGTPDGWANKGPMWFLLPGMSLAMVALFGGIALWIGALVRKAPALVNVPRKELFLRLSEQGRMVVVAPTRMLLAWMIVLMTALFSYILEGTGRVAVNLDDTLPIWPVFVFLGLVFSTLPFFMLALMKAVDRAARDEGVV